MIDENKLCFDLNISPRFGCPDKWSLTIYTRTHARTQKHAHTLTNSRHTESDDHKLIQSSVSADARTQWDAKGIFHAQAYCLPWVCRISQID